MVGSGGGSGSLQARVEERVLSRIDLEAFPALMLHGQGGFEQEDAPFGIRQHDAAAFGALNDLLLIEGRIEAEQAEPEAAAAVLGAMARALVAACLGEDRHD